MQWARIQKDLAPGHQGSDDARGKPERMKDRQGHHELVERGEVGDGAHLGHVRQHRCVSVHNTLRFPLRSGREQHDRRIFGALLDAHRAREEPVQEDPQPVREADLGLQILQIVNADIREGLHERKEPRLFEKRTRGDNCPNACGLARRTHACRAGGIIEKCWHTPRRGQGQYQPQRRRCVRHHDADDLVRYGDSFEKASQSRGHEQQGAVRFLLQSHVLHEPVARAEGGFRIEERLEQRALGTSRNEHVEEDPAHEFPGTPATQLRRRQAGHRNLATRLNGNPDLRK